MPTRRRYGNRLVIPVAVYKILFTWPRVVTDTPNAPAFTVGKMVVTAVARIEHALTLLPLFVTTHI